MISIEPKSNYITNTIKGTNSREIVLYDFLFFIFKNSVYWAGCEILKFIHYLNLRIQCAMILVVDLGFKAKDSVRYLGSWD